jgi:hypothetical protein
MRRLIERHAPAAVAPTGRPASRRAGVKSAVHRSIVDRAGRRRTANDLDERTKHATASTVNESTQEGELRVTDEQPDTLSALAGLALPGLTDRDMRLSAQSACNLRSVASTASIRSVGRACWTRLRFTSPC